jgi:hypothetical protein
MEKSDEYRYRKVKRGRKGNREIYFNEPGIIFDDWYDSFTDIKRGMETPDETGTLNRFDASVLKVAMLLSLAEHPKLILTAGAVNEAILTCEKLLGNIRKTTMGKDGISTSAMLKTMIIMDLLNRETHSVSRKQLMKKMWMHYNSAQEFDDMMASFDATGLIQTGNVGSTVVYTMPEEQALQLRATMEGRKK